MDRQRSVRIADRQTRAASSLNGLLQRLAEPTSCFVHTSQRAWDRSRLRDDRLGSGPAGWEEHHDKRSERMKKTAEPQGAGTSKQPEEMEARIWAKMTPRYSYRSR